MQVIEVKRELQFEKNGDVSIRARVEDGEDPLQVIYQLERMMFVAVNRYMAGRSGGQRCHVCGCTERMGCEGGCSWAEDNLCSKCACKVNELAGDLESAVEIEMLSDQVIEELDRCRGLLANEQEVVVNGVSSLEPIRLAIAQAEHAIGIDSDDDLVLKRFLSEALEALKACGSPNQLVINSEKVKDDLIRELKRCEALRDLYRSSPVREYVSMITADLLAAKVALQENDQVKILCSLEALRKRQ